MDGTCPVYADADTAAVSNIAAAARLAVHRLRVLMAPSPAAKPVPGNVHPLVPHLETRAESCADGTADAVKFGLYAVSCRLGSTFVYLLMGLRGAQVHRLPGDRRMPEGVNRVVSDHLATWCFAPTPSAVENLAREGIVNGVSLVGDLMQDLASRSSAGIRTADALRMAGEALELAGAPSMARQLRPGEFIFATIHRAENRAPAALAKWPLILADAARADRPVILALHPGTRLALEDAGVVLPPDILVVEPLGYRTSLTLQLHAAAVITNSGGVQREAAWLGTPCLVLRSTTEWTEAVTDSAGRMVVMELDRAAVARELERLAPRTRSAAWARTRARTLELSPAGAATGSCGTSSSGCAEPRTSAWY